MTLTATTNHSASSYGVPVLVDEQGVAYGIMDVLPDNSSLSWLEEPAGKSVACHLAHPDEGSTLWQFDEAEPGLLQKFARAWHNQAD